MNFSRATAILILATTSTVTLAGSIKNYPGSNCIPYINSQNSTEFYPSTSGSFVNNSSTTLLRISCPIVLDVEDGTLIRDVKVNVVDGNSALDVSCELRAGSALSSYLNYGSIRKSSGKSTSVQTLSFSNLSLASAGGTNAIAMMHCELPQKDNYYPSYIKSYSASVK